MKKFLAIILMNFNLFGFAFANPNIDARTGILVDYHSDEILYEFDADSQNYPA